MAAFAASHAAVPVLVPFPAHAADRLIGVVGAPCANTGAAGTASVAAAVSEAAALRRRTGTGSPRRVTAAGAFPVTREYGDPAPLVQPPAGCDCMTGSGNTTREDP
ncbi:hypothetical protein Ate01nite_41230 [Actinoplanes teichomyceticus]|nr:hypothetical protein Ate01nite_41230 [Actinoplanes teichomyceticus]